MRLHGKFGGLLLANHAAAMACAFMALAVTASPAGAAGRLHTLQLHAQAPSPAAFPFSVSPRHSLPLRVPNPRAYAAAKAAAERGYRAWSARHPQSAGSGLPQGAGSRPSQGAGSGLLQGARTAPSQGVGSASQMTGPSTSSTPPPQAVLFEGLNQAGMFGGGLHTSVTPPDTTGSIGPNDYIEMVNSEITVYDRATLGILAGTSEDNFVGSSSTCDGQIRWDQQGERWEYASLDCGLTGTEGFTFGWSKTADPSDLSSTGWCRYGVNTTEIETKPGVIQKVLFDYPKLGGSDEYLLIGFNAFAEKAKPAEEYVGSGVVTISKPAKGQSTCPAPSEIKLGAELLPVFTPVPANVYGSSTTGYVVASESPESETSSAKNIDVFTVTNNGNGEPEFHQPPPVAVSPYFFPAPVPQPGTTDGIDSSDTRLTQAVADEDPSSHQVNIWTQHTVATTFGLPSVVAWYELKAGSTTPVQAGAVEGPTGDFAFNGAISPTARGNGAAIDYNVGGPLLLAELHAQSHAPATASGAMENDVKLVGSEAADKDFSCPSTKETEGSTSCRWGDYAGASPDPLNPGVVWGTGETNGAQKAKNAPQWQTENFALGLHAPPGAAFSVTTPSPSGGEPVSFAGASGEDPVEPVAAYEWSFGDGATASGRTPTHTYARPGEYAVKLTVTDQGGMTSTVEHKISVADTPPTAAFGVSGASMATVPVSFDGSASHDVDGAIVSYEWSFGDGATALGATPTHTYAAPGSYTVTLKVVDDGGKSASSSQTVSLADVAPTASFAVGNAAPVAGTPVGFDGSGSKDVDGSVTGYSWSFGDGAVGGGAQATHVYTKAGAYTVKLTARDNGGVAASAEQTISVSLPSNVIQVTGGRANKKAGSLTLNVLLPGPGLLNASDASSARASVSLHDPLASASKRGRPKHRKKKAAKALIRPVSMTVSQGGPVTLQIAPSPAGKAMLKAKHKLSVRVLIAFTPSYGIQGSLTQTVVLQMSKPKRKHKRRK